MKPLLLLLIAVAMASCNKPQHIEYKSFGKIDFPLGIDDELMLDSIQRITFRFFVDKHHPEWGIVKDRAAEWSPSSIASTGFALPCYAIGVERQWMAREEAAQITFNTLNFFLNSIQSADTNATGYKGFYYHFLRMDTGTRAWTCELSSIDTGLLMMGIIFARNYYNQENELEQSIRQIAGVLLGRMEWDIFTMGPESRHPNTISMGWKPEDGPINWGWFGYNEALFLYVLAAGTGMDKVEESYQAWLETYKWQTPYEGLSHVAFPPLFGHQFSHVFIDYRGLVDPYMKRKGIDYFENSRRATLVQQQYAIENPHAWVGYGEHLWGVTACDGPGEAYNFDDKTFYGYAGRGASGPDYNYFDDGTIAPYGSISSLPFAPEVVLPTARWMIEQYGHRIWSEYGFLDAFNLTADWVNDDYIGIAQGPMLVMIENFRTGLVWDYVMPDTLIQSGLRKLGYEYLNN
jgi:hypothetical protein